MLGGFFIIDARDTMQGMYKLAVDGEAVFYELMLITEKDSSLVLRIRHFNPDFSAWEEKDEHVVFPLVVLEPGAAYFDGLTFKLDGTDGLRIWVALHTENEEVHEEEFVLRRVGE